MTICKWKKNDKKKIVCHKHPKITLIESFYALFGEKGGWDYKYNLVCVGKNVFQQIKFNTHLQKQIWEKHKLYQPQNKNNGRKLSKILLSFNKLRWFTFKKKELFEINFGKLIQTKIWFAFWQNLTLLIMSNISW